MDPRTAAHVLTQIAAYLELRGESRFKAKAYQGAARALVGLDTDDLAALDRDGTLAATRGLGPATLSVVRDLIDTGESRYLTQLKADLPPGVLELLEVPGLATPKIHLLHETLGVDSLDSLEAAAREGKLAKLKGFGPRTAERILKGIAAVRAAGSQQLYPRAIAAAGALLSGVRNHPDISQAEIAGSLRRHRETAGNVNIVAACRVSPVAVARSFARAPGVREADGEGTASLRIEYVDGEQLRLHCVPTINFAVALWRATGTEEHVAAVASRLATHGFTVEGDVVHDATGSEVPVPDEATLYALAGLAWVPPEMRESLGEVEAAARGALPQLLEPADLRGVLHCHTTWSDGKASVAEMAAAAQGRGWEYIGISDHSQAAFYAGGLTPDQVREQHDEIDEYNATHPDFRVLKGIEADILADGSLDYDDALLERLDFVIASVHSRFSMDLASMTSRVLRALEDPRLTILGHPTGRLLLSREAYAIDMEAVLEKAGAVGAAVELNADPHRLDLDWRLLPRARECGIPIEIGPDAHSTAGLDNIRYGVGMARKAGLRAADVLNTRPAEQVLAFARGRRSRVAAR